MSAGISTVIVVGTKSPLFVVVCPVTTSTVIAVCVGLVKLIVYVAVSPSSTEVSPLRVITVSSSGSGFSGDVSSIIVVATVAFPNATFSKLPLSTGVPIFTLYTSSPSAYASSTVATLKFTLWLFSSNVTVTVFVTISPVSADV